MGQMGERRALSSILRASIVLTGIGFLSACAEVEVGAEAVKAINQSITTPPDNPAPRPADLYVPAAGSRVNPSLEPAPAVFEERGRAIWDGRRTLQGIWVAHPNAEAAMRVRVIHARTGVSVDGALFRREASPGRAPILISSEAAKVLGLEPNESTPLLITALRPKGETPEPVVAEIDETGPEEEIELAAAEPDALEDEAEGGTEPTDTATTRTFTFEPERDAAEVAPDPVETLAPPESVQEVEIASADVTTTDVQAEEEEAEKEEAFPLSEASTTPPPLPPETEEDVVTAAVAPEAQAEESDPFPLTPVEPPEPEPVAAATPVRTPAPVVEPEPPSEQVSLPANEPPIEPVSPPSAEPPTQEVAAIQPVEQNALPPSLFVRAGTFSVRENADRLVTRIRAAGYPVIGRNFSSEGRELTTVTAGPFSSRQEQQKALKDIRAMGLTDAFASQ
ncbi:MAG: SPOR domain-containing protein [Pseudomonadota bacterium]